MYFFLLINSSSLLLAPRPYPLSLLYFCLIAAAGYFALPEGEGLSRPQPQRGRGSRWARAALPGGRGALRAAAAAASFRTLFCGLSLLPLGTLAAEQFGLSLLELSKAAWALDVTFSACQLCFLTPDLLSTHNPKLPHRPPPKKWVGFSLFHPAYGDFTESFVIAVLSTVQLSIARF